MILGDFINEKRNLYRTYAARDPYLGPTDTLFQ